MSKLPELVLFRKVIPGRTVEFTDVIGITFRYVGKEPKMKDVAVLIELKGGGTYYVNFNDYKYVLVHP